MEDGCDVSFSKWWKQITSDQRHGLCGTVSNHSKSEVKRNFLKFVDANSQPNGRSEESSVTHYPLPHIQTPQKNVKNYELKLTTSLLGEFNRVQQLREHGTCSNYSTSTCLKANCARLKESEQ